MDEKPETPAAPFAAIDQATLTPLVQSALNSETVEVIDWDYEQLQGGAGSGTAIYRFSGEGHDQGQKVPWSLILKTLCPAEDSANVSAKSMPISRDGWMTCRVAWQRRGVSASSNTKMEPAGCGLRKLRTKSARTGPWSTMASSPVTPASSMAPTWWTGHCPPGRGSVRAGCGIIPKTVRPR